MQAHTKDAAQTMPTFMVYMWSCVSCACHKYVGLVCMVAAKANLQARAHVASNAKQQAASSTHAQYACCSKAQYVCCSKADVCMLQQSRPPSTRNTFNCPPKGTERSNSTMHVGRRPSRFTTKPTRGFITCWFISSDFPALFIHVAHRHSKYHARERGQPNRPAVQG